MTADSDRSIATRYSEATHSFIALARTIDDAGWSTPVPCTPGWTVRDVLSHVSGVPDDGLAGRVDGAATDPWTASQVERNAHFTVDELLERWEGQYELFGAAIDQMGESRPPFDCHTHEHDVRHAIGRPGNRDSAVVRDASDSLVDGLADLPVDLRVRFDDGTEHTVGTGRDEVTLAISRFEMFRSRLGRRTEAQVRALDWTGSDAAIDAVVAQWFMFGPSPDPIDE